MFRLMTESPNLELKSFRDFFNDDFFGNDFLVDIKKTDEGYHLSADLPGFKKDEIKIRYEKDILTIEATKETVEESSEYLHKERTYKHVKRSLRLEDIDESLIKARLENGVLEVSLPKTEKVREIVIDIE